MIPQKLTLRNFLSYREATLDFQGLHTACICGANGAGKSSLLEAIAWAVWGQSRAAAEDDVIHLGEKETQVDFSCTINQHIYRIIRSRRRGQGTTLEFQVAQSLDEFISPDSPRQSRFRSLTAKGIRATQQLILDHLKLDYETFINSAYLRQGRADEFMLKRPAERKQILADLLKLAQYDELAEQAKDRSRQLNGQISLLERDLESIQQSLQQQTAIAHEYATLERILAELQQQQAIEHDQLQTLQATQHQRQTWQQQLTWQQQQQRILTQDCQRLQQELATSQQQQQELASLLQQEQAIAAGYVQFQTLQAQDQQFAARCKPYQELQTQRQQVQQQQDQAIAALRHQIQHVQTQRETLDQQAQDLQQTLAKATDVDVALHQLHQARTHLKHLDQQQLDVTPLSQRRHQIQTELDRTQTRLAARLNELQTSVHQLRTQQQRQPEIQQAVLEVGDRLQTLSRQRTYQEQIRERGLERRNFMAELQAHQRDYEAQLAEVEHKIQWLKQEAPETPQTAVIIEHPAWKTQAQATPEAVLHTRHSTLDTPPRSAIKRRNPKTKPPSQPPTLLPIYPPCPLCDRPLDEQHWQLVLQRHQTEYQALLDQIWVIREQLSACERELQILRQEYRELDRELVGYDRILEQRGHLQAQLQVSASAQATLQELMVEVATLEQTLTTQDYAQDLQQELHLLNQSLQALNYDEKDHALARGEVDRWRWAEIKQAEIKQAERQQAHIVQQKPVLERQLVTLQHQLEKLLQDKSDRLLLLDQQLAGLGYNSDQHNAIRLALQQAQPWQLRYQEVQQAQQRYPQGQQRIEALVETLRDRQQNQHLIQTQIDTLTHHLQQTPNCQPQIQALEQSMQQRRQQLDDHLAHLGRLQQQQAQLESLKAEYATRTTKLATTRHQHRIYQELAQAFGKNGIQALMIENVLPQLEAEANRILGRLSANQLHIQFVTQRAGKASKSNPKLIDTLDIAIADLHGTRPYETYSGGEAFRVNFAIRLALARLLAQRSGTALQLLIVDEGFGTQDREGCDRLIAAINAIAPDFARILTITHVPHFKEAFQSRIEVVKTECGSQLIFWNGGD